MVTFSGPVLFSASALKKQAQPARDLGNNVRHVKFGEGNDAEKPAEDAAKLAPKHPLTEVPKAAAPTQPEQRQGFPLKIQLPDGNTAVIGIPLDITDEEIAKLETQLKAQGLTDDQTSEIKAQIKEVTAKIASGNVKPAAPQAPAARRPGNPLAGTQPPAMPADPEAAVRAQFEQQQAMKAANIKVGMEANADKSILQDAYVLKFSAPVTEDSMGVLNNALMQAAQFKQEYGGSLKLVIDSPGGDLTAGRKLLDAMDILGIPIDTMLVGGLGASMGSLMFLAGNRRIMTKNGRVMIHQPSVTMPPIPSKAEDLAEMAKEIKIMRDSLDAHIAAKTGLDIEEVREMTNTDTFLHPLKSLKMGFATHVLVGKNEAITADAVKDLTMEEIEERDQYQRYDDLATEPFESLNSAVSPDNKTIPGQVNIVHQPQPMGRMPGMSSDSSDINTLVVDPDGAMDPSGFSTETPGVDDQPRFTLFA